MLFPKRHTVVQQQQEQEEGHLEEEEPQGVPKIYPGSLLQRPRKQTTAKRLSVNLRKYEWTLSREREGKPLLCEQTNKQ